MKTSDNGLKFIMTEEGVVLHTYADSRGISTVGVGHVLRPGESYPNGITKEQSLDLLRVDISIAENAINTHVTVLLTQSMYDSLASFVFNCGGGALASSTLLKKLNAGDYTGAADELLRWDHAGAGVNQAIHNRRVRERALFLSEGTNPQPAVPPLSPPEPVVVDVPPVVVPDPAPIVVVDPVPVPPVSPVPVVPDVNAIVAGALSPWKMVFDFVVMIIKFLTGRGGK